MADLIYNIKDIFEDDLISNGKKYNIPEYQRGYKWSSQQINQLLDDINEFETGGDKDLFYCLQNITIVESDNLNVVDGQQRLTTIALLLAYLGESSIVKDKINYAVRKRSNEFLQRIISNDNDNDDNIIRTIKESNGFDEFIKGNTDYDYDYQDIYFMYSAIQTMDKWFTEKESNSFDKAFKQKLLSNVKLIVNRVTGVTEQELFKNLNARRVQLDGADLVRAILITRVAKQEMEEYDSTEVKDVVRLNERRIRIGWELDELNTWWSKDNVSAYFSTFTSIKTGGKETIKFDQVKHPINLLYKIWAETNEEKEIKLSLFEPKNTRALAIYTSIILLHRTLKDWFEDREIYHYLGFLFSRKNITFKKVWDEWNKGNNTRVEFISFLKTKLKEFVFEENSNNDTDETGIDYWLSKIKDYDGEGRFDWKGEPKLQKILLLLEVIEYSNTRENGNPLPFIVPKYFRNQKEDEEHIFPSTPKDIKEISKLEDREKYFDEYVCKLNDGYETIKWKFPKEKWDEFSDEEKNNKLNELKAEIHKKRPINSIGNLDLLDRKTNRGYGNSYYPEKRIKIIENTKDGVYVRYHTLKVFVKQTDNRDLNNWTMKDIKENANSIHEKLDSFFKSDNNE